jgi:hypothetical protein
MKNNLLRFFSFLFIVFLASFSAKAQLTISKSSCNQGYTKDLEYKITYDVSLFNPSYTDTINTIQVTDDLATVFQGQCINQIDRNSLGSSNEHPLTYPIEYNGGDWDTTEFPNDGSTTNATPGANGLFNTASVSGDHLYPRQTINLSFCVYINPACAGGDGDGSGNGVAFDNVVNATSSGGNPTANINITDFHTTETTVAAELFVPEDTPTVNFDGTYDFTNTVVVTNDGLANATDVQYYLPMDMFVADGIPINTTVVSGTHANAAYTGTGANTGILALGTTLTSGESTTITIDYNVGPTTYSSWNYWGTPNPSMTQGAADGHAEDPNVHSYVEWSDAEGDHMDRFYSGSAGDTSASSTDQCSCPDQGMRFPYTVSLDLDKSSTSAPAASGMVGNVDYTFTLVATNNGSSTVQLHDLILTDNLAAICGMAGIEQIVAMPAITASDATTDPVFNLAYDGTTDFDIFDGTSGILDPGQSITVEFTVEFTDPCSGNNTASFSGLDPNDIVVSAATDVEPVQVKYIVAEDDDFSATPVDGINGGIAGNVFADNGNGADTVAGLPATDADIQDPINIINSDGLTGVSIDPNGDIIVPPGTPAGIYNVLYEICATADQSKCDTAIVTIVVDQDSDGDGVTDLDEIADGTDPNDNCDFVLVSQTATPSAAWDAADCDGDGISNAQEVLDGTDPLNPCEPTQVVGYAGYNPTNPIWQAADCDGDGVLNGDEDPATDPYNLCDYNAIDQVMANTTQEWRDADCDGDGVTNGQELTDGTDPQDPCDYEIANVTLANTAGMDCDNDGVDDATELASGTDPHDACSYLVADQAIPNTNTALEDCDGDGVLDVT